MDDLRPGERFAGCRIEAVAGRGGMGIVYRATEIALSRRVALKVVAPEGVADPAFAERFGREVRLAASIDHQNVVPVFGAGEEGGRLFLVMRYVDGTDLHALIRRVDRLEPARAAAIVAQVAAGLDAAHAAGLVHRDVKPANVLLTQSGSPSGDDHVYLTDFGLTVEVSSDTRMTTSGQWIGSVDYMSPEQLRNEPVDARTDVYALGGVLYAALTGHAPFRRQTVPQTIAAHLDEAPPRPSDKAPVDVLFDAVVARALAKDPADRYRSAGDLGRAAVAAARGERVTIGERVVARGSAAPNDEPTRRLGALAPTSVAPDPRAAAAADAQSLPPDPSRSAAGDRAAAASDAQALRPDASHSAAGDGAPARSDPRREDHPIAPSSPAGAAVTPAREAARDRPLPVPASEQGAGPAGRRLVPAPAPERAAGPAGRRPVPAPAPEQAVDSAGGGPRRARASAADGDSAARQPRPAPASAPTVDPARRRLVPTPAPAGRAIDPSLARPSSSDAETAHIGRGRRRGRFGRRRSAALAVAVAIAVVVVAAVMTGGGAGGRRTRSASLSAGEISAVARDFAAAYGHEDVTALRATLARNVQRVAADGAQQGRDTVLAVYRRQFAAANVDAYELDDLQVVPGAAGRAAGTYTVKRSGSSDIKGRVAFGIVREAGRAKIALIATQSQ